ncbi:MAG: mandelate racemase/muconate lactonizing enzyme family protein [Nitrososphaerota archaeon]|nr:mandelate racemase/muconate lactonizing enzyme family protein [Candidatus Bathyarchaeota archaeon]MDW8048115.1 mandelate racemase/muconate lactonizing enzyme family protein [Nitrososphaerota archaeon]
MEIKSVRSILLSCPIPENLRWKHPLGGTVSKRTCAIISVETDEGVEGIGEASGPPSVISAVVDKVFKPIIVGEDPCRVESLWEKMYRFSQYCGRRGVVIGAISGIEIALLDILGKSKRTPAYQFLGGLVRDKVRVYASAGMWKSPGEVAKEAAEYVNQGFTAIKIRAGLSPEEDVELVRAVRDAVGYGVDLMVDEGKSYSEPWTLKKVIRLAKEMERYEVYFLEEPLPPDDLDGYRKLCSSVDLPIATGENEFTRYGFKELLVNNAADIIQPDVTHAGGLLECKKIAAMASVWNVPVIPHCFSSSVSLAATIHFSASTSNCPIVEYDCTFNPLMSNLTSRPITVEDGYIKVPDKPGLGIELEDAFIKTYEYKGQDLWMI